MLIPNIERDGILIGQIDATCIDASNVKAFEEALTPLLIQEARLVLDLSRIEFIDSSGLGTLVSCLRQAHSDGAEIKLSGLSKPARALFELVRMHRIFEVFDSPEEAVTSYLA